MLKLLFTYVKILRSDLFCGASPGSGLRLFLSDNFFNLGFEPVQVDFQHDFTLMTDEADDSEAMAELRAVLFRSCEISQ